MIEQGRGASAFESEPTNPRATGSILARSRLLQVLLCPYCRDEVEREGAVSCARLGCGTLYHLECWNECSRLYGGCGVYGCASTRSKEISGFSYVLRFARVAGHLLVPEGLVRFGSHVGRETSAWPGWVRTREEREALRRLLIISWGLPCACGLLGWVSISRLESEGRAVVLVLLGAAFLAMVPLILWGGALVMTFLIDVLGSSLQR